MSTYKASMCPTTVRVSYCIVQVLKAVADAERSTRPGTAPTPSPLRPLSLPHSGGRGAESGLGSLSPSVRREDGGGTGGGAVAGETTKDSPRSASRFRTVAAAAAEEAKVGVFRTGDGRFLSLVRGVSVDPGRAFSPGTERLCPPG